MSDPSPAGSGAEGEAARGPGLEIAEQPESVWHLLTRNSSFTRVWVAQLISFAGDWVTNVALMSLLLDVTGSAMSVSLVLVFATLPSFFVTPLAGVVADSCDRRRLMIGADLVRAVLVLGLLLIRGPHDAWIAYALAAVSMTAGAFFGPASSAALPNLVSPRQLAAANALSSASWGVMLAVGAFLGGFISTHLGRPAAFMFDSASFLVSAVLVASVRKPFSSGALAAAGGGVRDILSRAWGGISEAVTFVRQRREILAVILIKTGWGVGGGVLALLAIFPVQVLHAGDMGVGVLYASRGLGSVFGPILARCVARDDARAMALAAAGGLLVTGVSYAGFALAPSLAVAAACVFVAHLGASIQWVFSTTLLQRHVEDRILGRVFSLDMGGVTLTMALSTLACGLGAELIGPRWIGLLEGLLVAVVSVAWLAWYAWLRPIRFPGPAR